MEDNITVLAGANNSGKTSLVELFDSVFAKPKGKLSLNKNDFPVDSCDEWRKKYILYSMTLLHCAKIKRRQFLKSVKRYLNLKIRF